MLVSASPGIADEPERAARRDADERLAQEIERDGVDAFLERWLAQPLFATLPRERVGLDERRAGNTVEGADVPAARPRPGRRSRRTGNGSGGLRMPVLLIVGARDTKYVEIAQRMADAIPDARVEVVPGAGHACHLEQPEMVAHLLVSW